MQKWKSVEENRKNGRDEKEFCNLIYESFYNMFLYNNEKIIKKKNLNLKNNRYIEKSLIRKLKIY